MIIFYIRLWFEKFNDKQNKSKRNRKQLSIFNTPKVNPMKTIKLNIMLFRL